MTDRYGVIGRPVAHSKSPWIHAEFGPRVQGRTFRIHANRRPLDGFASSVDAFRAAGGKGLNVTLPFKEAPSLLRAAERAREQGGVVNTLSFDGRTSGRQHRRP